MLAKLLLEGEITLKLKDLLDTANLAESRAWTLNVNTRSKVVFSESNVVSKVFPCKVSS